MVGQDAFDAILQRLPLSPQDFHVIGLASELAGWNESFLERPSAKSGRAKAKAKANGDQGQGQTDIGLALMSAAARPKAAPAPAPPPARPSGAVVSLIMCRLQHLWWRRPPPNSQQQWHLVICLLLSHWQAPVPLAPGHMPAPAVAPSPVPVGSASGASATTTSTRHAGG